MTLEQRFSQEFIVNFSSVGYVQSFAKGRVALYAGLKALGLDEGSEILMPGYTCVVVPSAVMFAGYKPVYVDICPRTYNIDPEKLPKHTTAKAMIVQHSYGIPANMEALSAYCQNHNLIMIEDACHSFASTYDGQLCGTFGKFSFFSGQWNKFFSSGLGGFLYTEDKGLFAKIQALDDTAKVPSHAENIRYAIQIMAYDMLVRPWSIALVMKLYRLLGRVGLAVGSSTMQELLGQLPDGYFARMAPAQLKRGIKELGYVDQNIDHRRMIGGLYQESFQMVPKDERKKTVFLRYPLRVTNKTDVLKRAAQNGLELGSWFETPLHGNLASLETFGYINGQCPVAEQACREVINLPTHRRISENYARKIVDFVENNQVGAT